MLVAAIASLIIFLQRIGVAGCGNECNFTLLKLAGDGFFVVAVVVTVATGVFLLVLPRRRRATTPGRDVWVPALGIGIILASAVVASLLISSAIDLL
jgi:hypothetical protein